MKADPILHCDAGPGAPVLEDCETCGVPVCTLCGQHDYEIEEKGCKWWDGYDPEDL